MARGLSDLQKWILAALAKRRDRNRPLLFSQIRHGFPPYAGRPNDPAVAVAISRAATRLERRGLAWVVYLNVSGTLRARRDGNRLGRWKTGRPLPRLKGRRAGYWAGIVLGVRAGGATTVPPEISRAKAREVREARDAAAKASGQFELPFSI